LFRIQVHIRGDIHKRGQENGSTVLELQLVYSISGGGDIIDLASPVS
jgi:hypothetical protein